MLDKQQGLAIRATQWEQARWCGLLNRHDCLSFNLAATLFSAA